MRISPAGVAFIKSFEGFVGHPYDDGTGVWTIGYGHIEGVTPRSKPMTEPQAAALLQLDLDAHYSPYVNGLGLLLRQNQFDALVSFVYNCGPGAVAAGTGVGRALRAHDWQAAADHLLDWDRAGGRVLEGLRRRRQAERALFLQPAPNPWAGYPADEIAAMRRWDAGDHGPDLRSWMVARRKTIWRKAQPKPVGDGRGWGVNQRTGRYQSLQARTN